MTTEDITLNFYLLSTISQTLGAILGLISVFLVFRVQILEHRWEKIFERLVDIGKELHIDYVYLAAEDAAILRSIRARVEEYEMKPEKKNGIWVIRGRLALTNYDRTRDTIKNIMKLFCALAFLSVLVIGASVWGLAINHNPIPPMFKSVVSFSLFGFFISLIFDLVFVIFSLRGSLPTWLLSIRDFFLR